MTYIWWSVIFSVTRYMDSSDNSSVSSNLSDCNYDYSNSEFDISIVNNENFSCGYVGQPEYNEEELKSRTFSSGSENESNDDLNSSRQEKFYWCKCTHCTVMPTLIRVYSMTNLKI